MIVKVVYISPGAVQGYDVSCMHYLFLLVEAGRLMARYCIAYDSMEQFLTIKGKESLSDMVRSFLKKLSEKHTPNVILLSFRKLESNKSKSFRAVTQGATMSSRV